MSESTATKSKVFKEDISLATGGFGEETGTRLTSTGESVTLTKLDASHIFFRNTPYSIEDLVLENTNDLSIYPNAVIVWESLYLASETSAGFVKNAESGLLSGGNSIATTDLPLGINAANIANGTISNTEFQYLNGVTSNIQDQLGTHITPATQAEQEAGTEASQYVAPATQQYHPSASKGWVKFSGNSTTIRADYNVATLTDGTATTTVNWETGFSGEHYAVGAFAEVGAADAIVWGSIGPGGQAAGSVQIWWTGFVGYLDPNNGHVFAFGDQ